MGDEGTIKRDERQVTSTARPKCLEAGDMARQKGYIMLQA